MPISPQSDIGGGAGGGVGFFDQIGCLRAPTVDSTEVARTWAVYF